MTVLTLPYITRTLRSRARGSRACWAVIGLAGVAMSALGAPPARDEPSSPAAPSAQPASVSPADLARRCDELRAQWMAKVEAKDYAGACEALEALIALTPQDLVARYNLVRIRIAAGRLDAAEKALQEMVEWGWDDFITLKRDPQLEPLRATRTYRAIFDNQRRVQDGLIDARLKRYVERFGAGYITDKDPDLRVAYVSGLPAAALADAKVQVARTALWWRTQVLPDGVSLVGTDEQPAPWVVVILPTRHDYQAWAISMVGDRADRLGGMYIHDQRELYAQDIGDSLRHEFAHALHHRHMAQIGRLAPMWIQEGLCSLPEDVRVEPSVPPREGEAPDVQALTPVPSWRSNTVRRMARIGNLPRWATFMKMDDDKFMAQRALGNYAVARTIFLYLQDRGQLRAWYVDYTAPDQDDASGMKSLASVLKRPLADVEKDWKKWLAALPEVQEPGFGTTRLPFDVDDRAGDGVRVESTPRTLDDPMARAGLRRGDVITHVDAQPVHDIRDVARAFGSKKPGDEVELTCRRDPEGTPSKRPKTPARPGRPGTPSEQPPSPGASPPESQVFTTRVRLV